jgi:predicted O-methyltransferase YrrM
LVKQLIRFLKFYFSAKTRYNVHSPFVFDFVENVLEDDRWFYAFTEIEVLRRHMLSDQRNIPITDFGAGSQVSRRKERSIASLAKYSAHKPFVNQMLFRLVLRYKPMKMLELGTSLGISTAYQAAAAERAYFITIEGDPNVAHLAAQHFRMMEVKNVALLEGRFEEQLGTALEELGQLDYLLVDGNHRQEPTLDYFRQCLPYAHEHSIFVFDDIHWSKGMEAAWASIQQHPAVTLSLDLYFFGVVFFRKDFAKKEHFKLVPWAWKPWAVGLGEFFGGGVKNK